jgi:signal peptidase II
MEGKECGMNAEIRRIYNSPLLFGGSIAFAVFALDQKFQEKMLGSYNLASRGRVEITSFLDLVLTWNKGISYGLFPQDSAYGQYILAGFMIAVSLALIYWLSRQTGKLMVVALGLIIGGALGNAWDRLFYGAVADFFSLHFHGFYWYIFNIADVAIVGGVILLLADSFFLSNKSAKS